MSLSFKEKLLLALRDAGELTSKMLTQRLSIAKMYYPTYYTTLRRLEEQGLVKKKRQGRIVKIALTSKGQQLLKKPVLAKRRYDGLSTIITFDIPEEKTRARRVLRRYLIRHGYSLLQESVLISPNHASKELNELVRELDIYRNVKIIAGRIEYA